MEVYHMLMIFVRRPDTAQYMYFIATKCCNLALTIRINTFAVQNAAQHHFRRLGLYVA